MRNRGAGAAGVVVLVALLSGALAACRGDVRASEPEEMVPDFRLAGLDGSVVSPSAYADRVLLLEFWATWCTPCRAQAKILADLYPEYAGRDVEFVAVSVGEPRETVEGYVSKRPFPYPVAIDPLDELSERLMIYVLPTVMIVDRGGRVVFFEAGIMPAAAVRKAIDGALGEQPA